MEVCHEKDPAQVPVAVSGVFALCSLGLTAAASDALGDELTARDTLLNQETELSSNVFWSSSYSDLRTENLVTYAPSRDVTPLVTFGGSLTARTTVTAAARELEKQGYRVVAGINGDFFNTSNGLPIGLLVSDGKLLSSDGGYYAVGFLEDGSAVIGKPGLSITADLGYEMADSTGLHLPGQPHHRRHQQGPCVHRRHLPLYV